jgi:hypoxanthine phosphoribosyltransferase
LAEATDPRLRVFYPKRLFLCYTYLVMKNESTAQQPTYEFETLYTEERIRQRVKELGQEIQQDYEGEDSLVLIGVLKGSFVLLADLIREIDHPDLTVDFIGVSSYGAGTESSREPIINLDIRSSIRDKNAILVEDIVDTGYSFATLCSMITARGPKSFKTCALLSKPDRREVEVPIDYLGFEIPDAWVEGYGIDTAEKGRNRKNIIAR